ncbi:hypothetical protein D3248_01690 [Leucobacter zeae]|nr:hypothetical protein [Leucobacter zeae]
MRELSPWAIRSRGREDHRARYARYIASRAWFARREQWVSDERARTCSQMVRCWGGCGNDWRLERDDMHHVSYVRLGDEAHEDLWPLCRGCHDALHQLMDSTRSWRKLHRELANEQAIAIVRARFSAAPRVRLRDYL